MNVADVHRHDIQRTLGLAIQILEEMPERLQPPPNIEDMRAILEDEVIPVGRVFLTISEAVAIALVYRTQQAIDHPVGEAGLNNRLQELRTLFQLVQRCDAGMFAIKYNEACGRSRLVRENRQRQ